MPGAQPTATHILKPRDTNPLDPHYKLPHKDADPVVVPKFIRDSIDISDIEVSSALLLLDTEMKTLARSYKSRPNFMPERRRVLNWSQPNGGSTALTWQPLTQGARSKIWNADPPVAWSSKTLQLDATDIEGAQVGWRPFHRKHIGVVTNDTTLNVADINRKPNIQTRPPPPEARLALTPREVPRHGML